MIPRFVDKKTNMRYDVSLVCTKCGWAVIKDSITEKWDECGSCHQTGLETRRHEYGFARAEDIARMEAKR